MEAVQVGVHAICVGRVENVLAAGDASVGRVAISTLVNSSEAVGSVTISTSASTASVDDVVIQVKPDGLPNRVSPRV